MITPPDFLHQLIADCLPYFDVNSHAYVLNNSPDLKPLLDLWWIWSYESKLVYEFTLSEVEEETQQERQHIPANIPEFPYMYLIMA